MGKRERFCKALSSLLKKFRYFRGVSWRLTSSGSLPQSGTEKVFEGGKWVRREQLLTGLDLAMLKLLAGYPNEGKEEFLAALDRMILGFNGLPNQRFNKRYNWILQIVSSVCFSACSH